MLDGIFFMLDLNLCYNSWSDLFKPRMWVDSDEGQLIIYHILLCYSPRLGPLAATDWVDGEAVYIQLQ